MRLKTWLAAHWFLAGMMVLIMLSVGLRGYQLAAVPHGMTWDEAAIGYDGYAVWTSHRDEWMKIMPLSFKSFGDYKAPLAIYVTGLFELVLGVNLWAVRLPFALSGVLGVIAMVLVTRQLLKLLTQLEAPTIDLYALLAGFGLSLSPWHLHLTRIGMESGMALTLVLLGVYFLLKYCGFQAQTEPKPSLANFSGGLQKKLVFIQEPVTWLLAAAFFLVMSLYCYHSTKLATPLVVLLLVVMLRKWVFTHIKNLVTGAVVGVALLVPLLIDVIIGHGSDRLSQAVIPIAGRTPWQIGSQLLSNLMVHFSPAFLVLGQTPTLRHGDGVWGVLLWPVFGLAVVSLASVGYFGLTRKWQPRLLRLCLLSLIWIVIGYLPAIIGWEVPHANRTLLALPGWIWLAVAGWDWLVTAAGNLPQTVALRGSHGETNLLPKAIMGLIVLSTGLFFIKYQRHYYTDFAAKSAADFQDGYLEMYSYIKPYFYNDPSVPKVDKIIMSDEYSQPYIYALFAYKMSPLVFNQGGLNRIEIDESKFVNGGSTIRPRTLVVATASNIDIDWHKATKIIYGSDGSIRFGIFVNATNP